MTPLYKKVKQRGLLRRVFTVYEEAWIHREKSLPSNFQNMFRVVCHRSLMTLIPLSMYAYV